MPLMMLLVFFEVIMRYAVGRPPLIADEFSAYMLVAVAFLGIAFTWRERGHVRITALVSRLPLKISSWMRLLAFILAFVFTVALTFASYQYLHYSFDLGLRSSTHLRFPLQGPQMVLPIGFALLSLVLIVDVAQAVVNLRSGKAVDEEAG